MRPARPPAASALGAPTSIAATARFSDLTWSPDGRWLLLGWRDADEWLFLQPGRPRHIVAISNISAQFAPGQAGRTAFPSVAGWCCSP
jgi:hypothetical protein